MFGWFASFGLCDHSRDAATSARWLRVSAKNFADWLPQLGSVLYLPPRPSADEWSDLPRGLLAGSRAVAPLLDASQIKLASRVSGDGPREWIDCIDTAGLSTARLYLLPDTDYLAWDAMLAEAESIDPPEPRRGRRGPRLAEPQLGSFRLHQFAGLRSLSFVGPGKVSPLGRSIAHDIAMAEGAAPFG